MVRNHDLLTDVRKLAASKPVCAAAGAGILASDLVRELPGRLSHLRKDIPSEQVTGWPGRAAGLVSTARAQAARRYDQLADRGRTAMNRGGTAGTIPSGISTGHQGETAKDDLSATAKKDQGGTAQEDQDGTDQPGPGPAAENAAGGEAAPRARAGK